MELEGLEHLSARMGPAGAMHHVATAHTVVCEIPVGLQNAFELAQEFLRTLAAAPHPKVKPKVKHAHCLPAGCIATSKPDGFSHAYRASVREPVFHRLECNLQRLTRGPFSP